MAEEFEGMAKALQIPNGVLKNLDKVDEKINKIAQDSENMAKAFQSAMSRMSEGSGTLLQRLTQIQGALKTLGATNMSGMTNISSGMKSAATEAEKTAVAVSKVAEAMNKYNTSSTRTNRMTDNEASRRAYVEKYEMYKKMFDQIERNEQREIRASKRVAQQIERDLQRQEAARARLDSRMRRSNYTDYVTSTEGSLRTAGRATNYNQRAQAIKNLEAAMKRLNVADANYQRDLNRLTEAHKKLNVEQQSFMVNLGRVAKEQSNLMNHSQQLARQLALLFSVSAIEGYVTKLIQVRGEFEKQNVALATLLGNQDQANKLQGQITELAVQSPFSLRELTSYTKSLAAYNVEYEQLYDTTKMLADVSSGLGVDMQRLILAFGQVKAANFLRGTETRQFTEAGINMLGELAKYYSELEGRIVSVGEVQERQFKRMISFQDVEAVFKRITSAGGMFYEMQERQAETLAGQWSNLTDSLDVMLNEIGTANDSTLKNMVSMIRDIIQNWEELVYVIKPAVIALGSYLAITKLASIGTGNLAVSLQKLTIGYNRATAGARLFIKTIELFKNVGKGLAASFTAMLPVVLIGGIVELTRRLTQASREAERFNKTIREITNTGTLRASELAAGFERLANEAVNAADGSERQKKALDELSRAYDGIIPQDDMKIERLREMKGAYDSVTTSIYNKIEADTRENLLQEVNNTYGTKAVEAIDALTKKLKDFGISQERAKVITNEFKKQWDAGQISSFNALEGLRKIIEDYTGEVVSLTETGIIKTDAGKQFGQVQIDELTKATTALLNFDVQRDKIMGKPITPFKVAGGTEVYSQLSKELNKVSKIRDEWEAENKNKFTLQIEFSEEAKKQQIAEYKKFIDSINQRISSGEFDEKNKISANLVIEEAQEAIDKLNVSPTIEKINALRLSLSQLTGVDFGKLNFTEMLPTDSMESFIKSVQDMLKTYNDAIAEFDAAKSSGTKVPWFQEQSLLQGFADEKELRDTAAAVDTFVKSLWNFKDASKGSSKNPALDQLKEQIKLIEEAYKRYQELNKYLSNEEATSQVREQFADTSVNNIVATMTFDAQGVIDGMQQVWDSVGEQAGEAGRKAFQDATREYRSELILNPRIEGLDRLNEQIEDLFNQYNLSIELESTGINPEVINSVFGFKNGIFSTKELRAQLEKMRPLFVGQGDEYEKAWEEALRNVSELEEKELQKRLKKYTNYLKQTVSERARIELEARKQIAEVDSMDEYDNAQKNAIKSSIRSEAEKQIQNAIWEDFKESNMYLQMFDDLDKISTDGLDYMIKRLENMKDSLKDLDPTDLKEIIDSLNELREEKISRNPFDEMGVNFKGLIQFTKERRELEKQITAEYEKQNLLAQRLPQQEITTEIARTNYNKAVAEYGVDSDQARLANIALQVQEKILSNIKSELAESKKNAKDLNDQYNKGVVAATTFRDSMYETANKIGTVSQSMKDFQNGMNDLFNMSDGFNDTMDSLVQFADSAQVALTSAGNAAAAFASGNIFQGVTSTVSTIGSIFSAVGALFSIGDKKKERQIQRELEKVEDLEKAYEKLEEAIDNAYSIDTYEKSYRNAQQNLEQQIQALEKSIALEEDKKKPDKDRIKEWEEQTKELREEQERLHKEMTTEFGGFGSESDIKSAAQEFADAWFEAFNETGDGLSGLEDKFDEYFDNIIKKQIMNKATEAFLKPILDQINAIFDSNNLGSYLENYANGVTSSYDGVNTTLEELDAVNDMADKMLPLYNEFAKQLMESLGIVPDLEAEGDTLSGLQKGIQGITEVQADALAALLESIRFFVSDENLVIHNIYNTLVMPTEENPFLSELRAQTEQLRLMYGLWNSVIRNVPSSGRAIKVQIV